MTFTTNLSKAELTETFKGGVIMDVVTPEQAKIAAEAGAVAVMALERVPADIRAQGGVARMSDPDLIEGILAAVDIPVMAKARIGHTVEAKILEHLGVHYVDESEVLSPADYVNHIDKRDFKVPFVCGATNLGEALRRVNEGAAMIRSKGRLAPVTSLRQPSTCAPSRARSRNSSPSGTPTVMSFTWQRRNCKHRTSSLHTLLRTVSFRSRCSSLVVWPPRLTLRS